MNSNQNAEISTNPEARPAGVPVRKRLASTPGAKRDVSQPDHETRALARAASRSSPVIKSANASAWDRGVEAILANHECVRSTKWELFAIVAFFVLSFAGLFFCAYVIWTKCRGTWPL